MIFALLALFSILTTSGFSQPDLSVLRQGDIIFQTSLSDQSRAIQLATNSPYSHMGIILETSRGLQVFEAAARVKFTPTAEWIQRGKDNAFAVKRLKNSAAVLTPSTLRKIKRLAKKFSGRPYDPYFEWSDEKIYCSELVWKILRESTGIEIGKLKTLGDFDLSNPVVQEKIKERYKDKIPYLEKVISPRAVFESELLQSVF